MTWATRRPLPHQVPPWVSDGAIFFITICAKARGENQLCNADMATNVFATIEFTKSRRVWWPHLVLLMPDHIHGLFSFAPIPGMKKAVSDWKHFVTRAHGIQWQRDFFDHRLRGGESYEEKASYIRENPVRAQLVQSAADWPYVREWRTNISVS